ncbi:MAG TPA: type II secretion system F family protein [Candidatus Saccharimonadales bacterium]|nr:type II secretion system F family protein [Candidatus Saccharimonadales bacterium]
MAEFVCKVGTPGGEILEQILTAESEEVVRQNFEARDYYVYSVRRKGGLDYLFDLSSLRRRHISSKEFLIFNQELASLIHAGLPIITSLQVLTERRKNPVFRQALMDVRDRVRSGAALSEAFEAQGELFPRLYCSSLASGERSGEIDSVLKRYIAYQKTVLAVRKKVISAITYPIILMVFAVGLVALLVTYIIPKFQAFFADFGAELPLITRIVVGTSAWVQAHILIILAVIVVTAISVTAWVRTPAGATKIDMWKLKVPLLGGVWRRYAISRFTRTLSTLIAGGIPLVASLDISARAVGNRIFEERMLGVGQKVREGESLWESLDKTGLVTDMAIEMIKVGESTGALEEMLGNVANFYDEEIDARLTTLVSLMEPAMLIFMAGVISVMLMAIYLPLIRSYSAAKF